MEYESRERLLLYRGCVDSWVDACEIVFGCVGVNTGRGCIHECGCLRGCVRACVRVNTCVGACACVDACVGPGHLQPTPLPCALNFGTGHDKQDAFLEVLICYAACASVSAVPSRDEKRQTGNIGLCKSTYLARVRKNRMRASVNNSMSHSRQSVGKH